MMVTDSKKVTMARGIDHIVHAVEVDAKTRQPVVETDSEHAVGTLADGAGIQQ